MELVCTKCNKEVYYGELIQVSSSKIYECISCYVKEGNPIALNNVKFNLDSPKPTPKYYYNKDKLLAWNKDYVLVLVASDTLQILKRKIWEHCPKCNDKPVIATPCPQCN